MLNRKNHNIILIGGFDGTGGAGILADYKVSTFLNINPYSITTSFAVQNSFQGYGNFPVSGTIIKQSLKSIFEESNIAFCKIGMVGSLALSRILSKELFLRKVKIILDTPLNSSSGFALQSKKDILPLLKSSFLITPNKDEFLLLGGFDFFFSLKTNFLIKSFNKGEDVLFEFKNNAFVEKSFKSPFLKIKENVRGTGCSLASAITCFLHNNYSLEDSVQKAKELIYFGIKNRVKQNQHSSFMNFTS